ncbi:MAG: beta-ketoacyl-ACP synthase III [Anaerolineae bacterium]
MNNRRYAQITGWGMCVPERVLTNQDLARLVDTSDEWIVSRTGIRERRVVSGDQETTATLATRAARAALRVASILPSQIDLVIVATATPEYAFPSTASLVQDALGASNAGAFDLSAGCSGFLYALSLGADAICAGNARHVLVIGAETLSKITDWSDRNTCVLFGDGAGAVVLSAYEERCGVLAYVLGSDGSGADLLMLPAGGSRRPASQETVSNGEHFLKMDGRAVFRFATRVMAKATEDVAQKAGWQLADLALVIPHQANARIIQSAVRRLNLPEGKFFVNLERYGNTSAASIPIALCEAIASGQVKDGDRLVLVGFGAGLTWAAVALEWGVPLPVQPQPWLRRLVLSLHLIWGATRSALLRAARQVFSVILGPEEGNGWRGATRRRIEHWWRQRRQGQDEE